MHWVLMMPDQRSLGTLEKKLKIQLCSKPVSDENQMAGSPTNMRRGPELELEKILYSGEINDETTNRIKGIEIKRLERLMGKGVHENNYYFHDAGAAAREENKKNLIF